jgi:hypothetical protein
MAIAERLGVTALPLSGRGLLGFGAGILFLGWGATELAVTRAGVVPGDPFVALTVFWGALFLFFGVVTLTQCPDYVRTSQPLAVWGVLNAAGLLYTGAAVTGLLPAGFAQYAYWHVWVLVAVVGFGATGALLERSGSSGQHYFTAAGLEVSLLFIGLGAFDALVHPTPLALDALPRDLGPGPAAVIQLSLYALGLGLVLLS